MKMKKSPNIPNDISNVALSIKMGEKSFYGVPIKTKANKIVVLTNAHCVLSWLDEKEECTIEINNKKINLINGQYFDQYHGDANNDFGIFEIESVIDENLMVICQMASFQRVLPALYIHSKTIHKVQLINQKGQHFHKLDFGNGKSGSPIVYKKDKIYYVVGLHSGICKFDKQLKAVCIFDHIKCSLINHLERN